jgi:hypothetical protein
MCLPTVFAPFVRRELLTWNPLLRPPIDTALASMEWHRLLADYGAGHTTQRDQHVAGTEENDHDKVCTLSLSISVARSC